MPHVLDGMAILPPVSIEETCPICGKAPHPERTTTDKKEEKGCLESKPKNLGCSQIPQRPDLPNYATAAHHLIPANQCLKQFPRLSQMCDTVGYDVNNKENGMALPTCGQQDMNSYTDRKIKYGQLSKEDKQEVAFVIMEGLDMQWHVGHHNWKIDYETDDEPHPENYDRLVKMELRDIELEIEEFGEDICEPEEGESGEDVVKALNGLSGEIKDGVKSWDKFFVSALAASYAEEYK